MKKTPLLVLWSLSFISTCLKVFSTFFSSLPEQQNIRTGDAEADKIVEEANRYIEAQFAFSTNTVNKTIALLLLVLLAAALILALRNRIRAASFVYLGYLGMTLIRSIYVYLESKGLANIHSMEEVRQATVSGFKFSLTASLVLFVIFSAITLYNLFRKPSKSYQASSSSGLDI